MVPTLDDGVVLESRVPSTECEGYGGPVAVVVVCGEDVGKKGCFVAEPPFPAIDDAAVAVDGPGKVVVVLPLHEVDL